MHQLGGVVLRRSRSGWRPRRLRVVLVALSVLFGVAVSPVVSSASAKITSSAVTAAFRPVHAVSTSTLQSAALIMSRRLADLGASSSRAVVRGGVIDVSLVNVKAPTSVLSMLGAVGKLYLRQVRCSAPSYRGPTHSATVSTASSPLPACSAPYAYSVSDFSGSPSSAYHYPSADPAYAFVASTAPMNDVAATTVILSSNGSNPYPRVVLGPSEVTIAGRTEVVDGSIIKSAYASRDTATNQWFVVFTLTGRGLTVFNAIAVADYGTPVADVLDGVVLAAPIFEARSFPGSAQLAGSFTQQRATSLASVLDAGPLPVAFTIQRESR